MHDYLQSFFKEIDFKDIITYVYIKYIRSVTYVIHTDIILTLEACHRKAMPKQYTEKIHTVYFSVICPK